MAKKKVGRPPNPAGEGTQVRLDTDLVVKARYLVAHWGGLSSLTGYLSDILRPVIEEEFDKAAKELIQKDKKNKIGARA